MTTTTNTNTSTADKPAKRTPVRRITYPMGSVSSGTMREQDLIPTFLYELEQQAKQSGILPAKRRRKHLALCGEIESRMEADDYYTAGDCDEDLNELLWNALDEYSGPYFYFGAHPGDGADYGWWLSEDWEEDFTDDVNEVTADWLKTGKCPDCHLKVADLADVPKWFRGEVAVVTDHGNVSLYVKTARSIRMVWEVV